MVNTSFMKKLLLLTLIVLNCTLLVPQQIPSSEQIPSEYFVTHSREEYIKKLIEMPYGIKQDDPVNVIVRKIETYLENYQPQDKYPDDYYAKESNIQALISVKEGGYGIGAILIDATGRIIARSHNKQIQKHRSDLHGEMSLLTEFEQKASSKKYMNLYVYKPGLTVFSSAEPCPMCFIRLATVGVDTKFCTPGPDDGMVNRVSCLPQSWVDLASKCKFEKANSSPLMQKTAHLLFFSFLLDGRGPK
jgi:tRNA(Arg) A34 adenosine deaminase TadA